MKVKIIDSRISFESLIPKRAGDAGMDLRAAMPPKQRDLDGEVSNLYTTMVLRPQEQSLVPSGIQVAIPIGFVGLLLPRSGLGVRFGIGLGNTIGVIDSNYRGEIIMALRNNGDKEFTVNPLDRIAQLVVVACLDLRDVELVDELDDTERGSDGFGSSGVK